MEKKRGYKCPCCNNPWSNDLLSCQFCIESPKPNPNPYSGINLQSFNHKVKLSDNFFDWSIGGWRELNPIPQGYSEWNSFLELIDLNYHRIKNILDEFESVTPEIPASSTSSSSSGSDQNNDTQKLKDFYSAMMDEKTIESRGISPLSELFNICFNFKVYFFSSFI